MLSLSRRSFLGASLAGLASAPLLAADQPAESTKPVIDDPAFQPDTLFLTWQRDPTTTMTVQWLGTRGETADPVALDEYGRGMDVCRSGQRKSGVVRRSE